MGYVTRMGHGYGWSGYGYGLEIPTHQKPLPAGWVGMGWCGFFSSNLHHFQAHQCTPPSSTPPASESLFTMAIDSIIQAPQHAPPSSSPPVSESSCNWPREPQSSSDPATLVSEGTGPIEWHSFVLPSIVPCTISFGAAACALIHSTYSDNCPVSCSLYCIGITCGGPCSAPDY